ncbi:redoxin family protein [Changchengzhania lutea]|uniref:redoxin family protein n=1 Tax=Changchengzhania lutea TaxID=2049305 RepID=UPI00115C5433|nr:redoxin family protein [Changchengzhania lutea]
MKKLLFILLAISIVACKEEPKDYVTFSGKITDKNSDSVVVRSRSYSKTIEVNEDGTFKDTLKVDAGVYNFFDGNESSNLYLKNGYDIAMTLDTKEFDETITYSGNGSEHSNFLAEKALLEEDLLDFEKFLTLDESEVEPAMEDVKIKLEEFYNSNKNVDTSLTNSALKNLEPMMNYYKKSVADKIYLETKLGKGTPSPTFEAFENYDGSTTSLSDLKGKFVYVDVWATWCGPCKREIPSLKKVEADYHGKDIAFVSLSIDDDRSHGGSWDKAKEDWKAMVADKELGGIQLFAPKGWQTDFVREYKINGIPRFILIDPNGQIVSADAPRPSDPKLKDLFTELKI